MNTSKEYSKESSFQKHTLRDSAIYATSVRIMALDNEYENVYASGTGVVIAQNLVLTAKHVFEDFAAKWKLPDADSKGEVNTNNFNIWVVFMSNHPGQLYHVYAVAQVYICMYSDFVLFHLDPFDKVGKGHKYFQIPLSLPIPKVGDRIVAFGFPKSKVNIRKDHAGTSHIEVNDEPSVSVGEIKEVYPERRDSFMLTFPCVRTNARLEGGMSGGPVFNDEGKLVGVVCAGTDVQEGEEPISYVALLWPLMSTLIVDKGVKYPLLDLAKKSIVKAEGLEHIILSKTDNENLFGISYNKDVARVKKVFADNIGRNEKCPCGSGRKYKNCCSP